MKNKIKEILSELEDEYNITILYACEAGSRVWGFDNIKSDYDIRFIYKHNNLRDYLTLTPKKDYISHTDNPFDILGWDIKKALNLHYKSNPNLYEWINSDKIYIDNNMLFNDLDDFNQYVLMNHYYSMALKHWNKYCKKQNINIKKYLYVIRCILTWNILNIDKKPPINIFKLLENYNSDVNDYILELIYYYKNSGENELNNNIIQKIYSWCEKSLQNMNIKVIKSKKDIEKYDDKFYEIITGV